MLRFDHLAIAAEMLLPGTEQVERALAVAFAGGGKHAAMGTHNRLLGLGDLYLEVIAVDPAADAPARPRWFDLDRFAGPTRLTNWVARCDDLEAALAMCPPGIGRPVQFERGPYRWRMAVPDDGQLPFDGCFPALIQWQGPAHPVQVLPQTGLHLGRFDIVHPQADALRAALAPLLNDPRISFSHGAEKALCARFDGPKGEKWFPSECQKSRPDMAR